MAYRFAANQVICVSPRIQKLRRTDLRPSADRSAVRTFLVAGGGLAAGSQHAYSLGSCAMRQADGRIALFQNVPLGRDIITHRLGSFW